MFAVVPWTPSPCWGERGNMIKAQMDAVHTVIWVKAGEYWVWGAYHVTSYKQACSLSQKETLSHPSRLLATNTTLRHGPGNNQAVPCILGRANKTYSSMRDSKKTITTLTHLVHSLGDYKCVYASGKILSKQFWKHWNKLFGDSSSARMDVVTPEKSTPNSSFSESEIK